MVLERLSDGAPRHLSALQDSDTRSFIFILCLPLFDGIFATMLVTGTIQTFSDIIAVALTVFTGAGALSVLYSAAENRQEARQMVDAAAPFLLAGAVAVAVVAPVFGQLLHVERMKYAAALSLLVIALQMLEVDLAEKMSVPAIIVTGVVLSLQQPAALSFTLGYVLEAVLTASAAVIGLYIASLLDPELLDLSRIRVGGGLVLATIAFSMFGVPLPENLGLTVFAVSVMASMSSG